MDSTMNKSNFWNPNSEVNFLTDSSFNKQNIPPSSIPLVEDGTPEMTSRQQIIWTKSREKIIVNDWVFLFGKKQIIIFVFTNILVYLVSTAVTLIYISQITNAAVIEDMMKSLNQINRVLTTDLNGESQTLGDVVAIRTKRSIEESIQPFEDDVANVKKGLSEIVESDCGGVINIPSTKTSYQLQYKLNKTYTSNENCLWTVENTEKSVRSQLTLKVELISHGFRGDTGLYAYEWNRDTNLTSEKMIRGKELELSAEGLYFSFTSDNETSTRGTGFLLKITVIQSELKTYGSNLFFRTSPGSHNLLNYQDGDQISIAINPSRPITFLVNSIDSEEIQDRLNVYEIMAQGKFSEKASLSGRLKSALSFNTLNPVLSIFTSDFSTRGKGFKISWTSNNDLIR